MDIRELLGLLRMFFVGIVLVQVLVIVVVGPFAYVSARQYNAFCKPDVPVTTMDMLLLDLDANHCARNTTHIKIDK